MINSEIFSAVDRWYVRKDLEEIVDLYYNADSTAEGQFVENHIDFDTIQRANQIAQGDVELFFDYLQSECLQYCIDKGTDGYDYFMEEQKNDLSYSNITPFAFGQTEAVMNSIVKIATDGDK